MSALVPANQATTRTECHIQGIFKGDVRPGAEAGLGRCHHQHGMGRLPHFGAAVRRSDQEVERWIRHRMSCPDWSSHPGLFGLGMVHRPRASDVQVRAHAITNDGRRVVGTLLPLCSVHV